MMEQTTATYKHTDYWRFQKLNQELRSLLSLRFDYKPGYKLCDLL